MVRHGDLQLDFQTVHHLVRPFLRPVHFSLFGNARVLLGN